ncbi:FIST N-terminal domain-containing protein [Pelomonas sp. SE-A7]|uniref:FIST signal transduction protein n=1 Tax=Pelomonas sp. SE-A7 TaxID=3054953 RepID=UPI00259C73C8|nr:FIST N-terminal domain-containing protein [Pelomonas sp. SE-A7]MDM4768235.1 FIST C-terminal domain-containing protein [Pelomonas sp. SE-A7]
MKPFATAHATHPQPQMALALAAAQIDAQRASSGLRPTLGWLYLSDAFAPAAEALLDEARQRWPGVAWVGCSAVGLIAEDAEYFGEPAVALLLAELPTDQFRVFSGAAPLGRWPAQMAQVHADAAQPDLVELLGELAGKTADGYLFGGLPSSVRPERGVQIAEGVWSGGLSGVGFGPGIEILSRVSQGCQPLGREREVSDCEGNLLLGLDGEPALDLLLQDLALPVLTEASEWREALPRLRQALAGLRRAPLSGTPRPHAFGDEVMVRHLVGIDPARHGVAVGEGLRRGDHLSFCQRNREAARRDLVRICSELREAAGERPMQGAIYVSCAGRGGPHFGSPSAEARIVRHALGEVPLVGFFAGGEIAHDQLYGYTGVLSVFVGS